jgi:hypothetical protein
LATKVTQDLVANWEYDEDDRAGTFTRVFRVDGLDSTNGIADDALTAIDGTDNTKRVPRAGERHPKMGKYVCRRVRVEPVPGSTTAVKLKVQYYKVSRRLLDIRVNGVSIMTTANKDAEGKLLTVGYNGPSTQGGTVTAANTPPPPPNPQDFGKTGWEYELSDAPFFEPLTTYEVVYMEDDFHFGVIKKYRRRTNSRPWNGGAVGEWFCEGITARIDSPIPTNLAQAPLQDGVVTGRGSQFIWEVSYSFRFAENYGRSGDKAVVGGPGWKPLLLFHELATGRVPTDVDPVKGKWPDQAAGNGWSFPTMYPEADFGDLNLVEAMSRL